VFINTIIARVALCVVTLLKLPVDAVCVALQRAVAGAATAVLLCHVHVEALLHPLFCQPLQLTN
jgi:hypothetical protein